jgi:hypothetical protein
MVDGLAYWFSIDREARLLVGSRKGDLKVFAYPHKIERDGRMNTQSVAISVRAIFLDDPVSKIYTQI